MTDTTVDHTDLLEKYNPILVLFPQEPETRSRPGARNPGPAGWGDYHPCSAEFFLHRVQLRTFPPPFDLLGPLRGWRPLQPTGLDTIKKTLGAVQPKETEDWELDVAEIPSQSETKAWRKYGSFLQETDKAEHPYQRVVYGRFFEGPPAVLQYWYLYIYNDFRNNHEADWEMVTIGLSDDDKPMQMGLSGHHGGTWHEWGDVHTVGDRPVVRVALGSHAGFFEYRPKGYHVLNFSISSNLLGGFALVQSALRLLESGLRQMPLFKGWRDLPPADDQLDVGADPGHTGVRVCPKLRVLPDNLNQPPDSEWWWLRYGGKWGSTRPRFSGAVGIGSPWGIEGENERWADPNGWLALRREEATS